MARQETRKRRTRADGERSYRTILDTAARLATTEGLEGLSIGRLAGEIGMSKSGLYAHFDSKQQLQLATVGAAEDVFTAEVVTPALEVPEGLGRLKLLCAGYLSYVKRGVFPGGCFSPPPRPSGTPAKGRSATACAPCSPAGPTSSRPTSAKPSGKATWRQTPTPDSSPSRSTPCSMRPMATTCSSATPPRSSEPEGPSTTDSQPHSAERTAEPRRSRRRAVRPPARSGAGHGVDGRRGARARRAQARPVKRPTRPRPDGR